jgi:hypothetical protein
MKGYSALPCPFATTSGPASRCPRRRYNFVSGKSSGHGLPGYIAQMSETGKVDQISNKFSFIPVLQGPRTNLLQPPVLYLRAKDA